MEASGAVLDGVLLDGALLVELELLVSLEVDVEALGVMVPEVVVELLGVDVVVVEVVSVLAGVTAVLWRVDLLQPAAPKDSASAVKAAAVKFSFFM